jgi:hypothetical protein
VRVVCNTLLELEQALKHYAQGFDATLLSGEQAVRATRAAACIEKLAASLKGLAGARAAEAGAWKGRSAAAELARVAGRSVSAAAETLETARRLQSLPVAAAAARRGELSEAQVLAIAAAAEADPGAESRLVELASRSSLAELREECARVKAGATDLETRRQEIHASRFLRHYTDAEGAWNLRMRDNPEVGAEIMAAIQPIRDRLFAEARADGRREPPEAYAADALVELARSGGEGSAKGRAKVIARVDLPTLLRGYPVGDEVCELAGYGPVAVSAVRDLIDTADPFLAAVVTKGEAVVGVAHLGRRANARQQTALEWLYPTCAVQGCGAVARLENDHRVDWSATHLTVFDLLDRLCPAHHRLKTVEGWRLVEGTGKRAFVPPDDPRHPGPVRAHAPPRAEAAA